MSIAYEDLKPVEASFMFNKREYLLRPFDLTAQVWAHSEFATEDNNNGVEILSERIKDLNDFEPILKCTWHLLKRKRDFGFFSDFVDQVEKGDADSDKYKLIGEIYKAFVQTLGVSQPQLEDIKDELELKKLNAVES